MEIRKIKKSKPYDISFIFAILFLLACNFLCRQILLDLGGCFLAFSKCTTFTNCGKAPLQCVAGGFVFFLWAVTGWIDKVAPELAV